MSRSIGLLLAIVVALGLIVAFNPEARAGAVEAWAQVQTAWADFSDRIGASMGAAQDGSTRGSATAQDSGSGLHLPDLLHDLWVSVSASVSAR
jgi:hypothetical protein